jgi:hypothetical protein
MRAVHVGLRVSEKRRPLRFYRIELAQSPTSHADGTAKADIA